MFHRIIFLLLIVSSLSCLSVQFVFSRSWTSLACRSTQNAARIKCFWRLNILIKPLNKKRNMTNYLLCWSVTLLMFIRTLHSSQPAGRIGYFGNFFSGFAKSPRVFRSSWILNKCNLFFRIMKYCILAEVCMIKTTPHSTASPQLWCIKSIKDWFARSQICCQDFVKKTCRTQKNRPDLFSRPHLQWSRAILALKCDRRWLLFFGCTNKAINSM